ncbi:MAG: UPF0158 family protein [Actinomycetota bacterium]|nr:UPF0158 family protein [Actinomycetota bacterium]
MGHDRWIDELRVARADPVALAALLSAELPYDGLQHAGDAVLVAQLDDADAALPKITTELIESLRARGWDGDNILADDLERDPATSSPELTPVGVDLADLADALAENAGSEGFLDLHDRQVWTETIIEASRDAGVLEVEFDDPTRWLLVVGQGSAAPYGTMQRFIATIEDHDTVGRLTDAIDGKGAFRRFYTQLQRYPDLLTRWHRFNNDTRVGHARQWLADHGYQPKPGRPT